MAFRGALCPWNIGAGDQFNPALLAVMFQPPSIWTVRAALWFSSEDGAILMQRCLFPWDRNPDRRCINLASYPAVAPWHDATTARLTEKRDVAILTERRRDGSMSDAERDSMFGAAQFTVG